jgi:hypothetical protein
VFEHVSEERIKSVYIKAFKEIKSIRNSIWW